MNTKPPRGSLPLVFGATALLLFQLTASAQTLTHRYSFFAEPDGSQTATDTVAQANGILNPNGGDANITGGQLVLDGTGGTYVELPAGIITNDLAVTVETWGDFPNASVAGSQGNWANLFDFGTQDAAGDDSYSISFCVNVSGTDGECDAAISDYDNANTGRENLYSPGTPLNGLTGAHVVAVFNPPQHYAAMYVNGALIAERSITNTITPGIKDENNKIGDDNWPDPTMTGNLDEFRIYNGALNSLQVAANYQAGWTATNTNPGTVTNVQLQTPSYQLVLGGVQYATVIGAASGLTNKSIDVTLLSTFGSSNTNILTVSNNLMTALAEGSATVTAQCGTGTSSVVITVIPPVSVLAHRYSFFSATAGATTVADSVGTALCTLMGTAQISGGQLVLDGTTNSYASLPSKIITTNYSAVTIDTWASFSNSLPTGMFFDFGNTDTNSTYGEDYIFCSAASGRAAITADDPGFNGEQGVTTIGWAGRTNLHATVVFNPPGGYVAIYTNGLLAGTATGITDPLSVINDVESYIGRSDYEGDSGLPCEIKEFRIFNGALTSQEVAISDAAGMQSVPGIVTNGPGTLTSITLSVPATLHVLEAGHAKLLANYSNLTSWDLLGNSLTPPAGLTVFTSNTNILSYSSGGVLNANSLGTATLTVIYQGTTNTARIAVVNPPAPALAHRYSFWNEPDGSLIATDTVSQANGTMQGDATTTSGQLVLDGTAGTDVQLPSGIITNDLAVTIEVWGDYPNAAVSGSQGTWANLFDFGQKDASGADSYSLSFCVNVAGNGGQCDAAISDYDNANTDRENLYPPGTPLNGQTDIQLVVVFNPTDGYSAIYTNGALAATMPILSTITPGIRDVNNWIGEDNWGDPTMIGKLDEFRIYNGVLAPSEVAQSYAAGPTNLPAFLSAGPTLKATVSGTNLILTWPSTATGFSVQSSSAVKSGSWSAVSGSPTINNGSYQLSVPITGAAQFFRLAN
jgi:hypothetical protein